MKQNNIAIFSEAGDIKEIRFHPIYQIMEITFEDGKQSRFEYKLLGENHTK